jgi:hypothetical protein
MVRVKELDGVLLQLIKVIGDGMAPPEQLSRFQRLIVDAGALAKVCRRAPPPAALVLSFLHVCTDARSLIATFLVFSCCSGWKLAGR